MARLPVGIKIFGSMAAVILVIVGFQITYFPGRQIDQLTTALEQKAMSLARIVAHEVATGLEFEDRDVVADVFAGVEKDRDFRYVALYSSSGALFAGRGELPKYGPDELAMVDDSSIRPRGRVLEVSHPVRSEGGTEGLLKLGISTALIEKERATIIGLSSAIAAVILAIGLMVAWLLGASIGRRTRKMAEVAKKVAAGDLGHPLLSDASGDELGKMAASFNLMIENLRTIERRVVHLASGDFSYKLELPGDLAAALNQMIQQQADLVTQLAETAVQLNSAAGEFLANARQQERGASEQSSGVEEIRRTMESLLGSAREIGRTANDVLGNAERTQSNSQLVSERIAALSQHSERIVEILEVIKDIANKSDLLALNAALEGTKAGEAGRGFSLVATQMQRLAENVMGSVRDIKDLTTTITEATQATVLATEGSTKLSADTTQSVRQIALIIQQQQTGTEQATRAIDDVSQVAEQTASASKEIVSSAMDLQSQSEQLQSLIGRFRLGETRAE